MTNLTSGLNKPSINNATRSEIWQGLWPRDDNQQDYLDWDPYFQYYIRQCHNALIDRGQHVLVRTHQDVIDIVRQIEDNSSRDLIKTNLRSKLVQRQRANEDAILDGAIDLAARLHLMINTTCVTHSISAQTQLKWMSGTLKDELENHFKDAQILGNEGVRLDRSFTAANLERVAGIQIKPTDNLADHLRLLDKEDKIVAVFHHASFLERQTSTLLPTGLKEETLRTLVLLFPQHDSQTGKFLQKNANRHDKMLSKGGKLRLEDRQIEGFHFWHDRLVMLKQAFDDSRPATIRQWWFDRRNGVQWYTFWIAVLVLVLTIFFGMVQSIEGALQVYKAYHPS